MIVLPNSGYLISCSLDKTVIKTDVINDEGKIGGYLFAISSSILNLSFD